MLPERLSNHLDSPRQDSIYDRVSLEPVGRLCASGVFDRRSVHRRRSIEPFAVDGSPARGDWLSGLMNLVSLFGKEMMSRGRGPVRGLRSRSLVRGGSVGFSHETRKNSLGAGARGCSDVSSRRPVACSGIRDLWRRRWQVARGFLGACCYPARDSEFDSRDQPKVRPPGMWRPSGSDSPRALGRR